MGEGVGKGVRMKEVESKPLVSHIEPGIRSVKGSMSKRGGEIDN